MPADQPWFLIPEFIGLFVGIFSCWLLALGYTLWSVRKSRREQLLCLHENLQKVNLAWSNTEAAIKSATEVDFSSETQKEQKWFLLAGLVLSLASWLGFLLLVILIVSLEYLARPRIERELFQSELAFSKNLSTDHVQKIVNQIIQK